MGQNSKHFYNSLLGLIAIVAAAGIVYVSTGADDIGQQVTVNNSVPSFTTIGAFSDSACTIPNSSLTLTEGTTSGTLYFCGVAADANGEDEIDSADQYDFVFFESGTETSACVDDDNDCYRQLNGDGITVSNCHDTICDFIVEVDDIKFHAAPAATWKGAITVADDSAASASLTMVSSVNVEELTAFTVTPNINFGSLSLGQTSSGQLVTFTNTGNVVVDANQTATADLVCSAGGSIPIGNVRRSFFPGAFGFDDGILLTLAETAITNLDMPKPIATPSDSVKNMYVKIHIPDSGVAGTCSNSVSFLAVADE